MLEVYDAAGAGWSHRDRVRPPLRGHERHVRVGAAGRGQGPRARDDCVDSRQVGVATGFAALTAAEVLAAGGSGAEAAAAARRRAGASASLFYVDTLEYLRRGGRIGAAAAIFGGALAVKPLLTHRRRAGSPPSRRSAPPAGRSAGSATSRWRRPVTGRSTCAWPTWPAPSGPSRWRDDLAIDSPTTSPTARSGAASWVRCSVPTWARAWWRSAWRPADRGPRAVPGTVARPAVLHRLPYAAAGRAPPLPRFDAMRRALPHPSTRRRSPAGWRRCSAELASVRGDGVPGHQPPVRRPVAPGEPRDDPPGATGWLASRASAVPVPGRHASRRLVDRVRLAPAHLAVVPVLVALGVGWPRGWRSAARPSTGPGRPAAAGGRAAGRAVPPAGADGPATVAGAGPVPSSGRARDGTVRCRGAPHRPSTDRAHRGRGRQGAAARDRRAGRRGRGWSTPSRPPGERDAAST